MSEGGKETDRQTDRHTDRQTDNNLIAIVRPSHSFGVLL